MEFNALNMVRLIMKWMPNQTCSCYWIEVLIFHSSSVGLPVVAGSSKSVRLTSIFGTIPNSFPRFQCAKSFFLFIKAGSSHPCLWLFGLCPLFFSSWPVTSLPILDQLRMSLWLLLTSGQSTTNTPHLLTMSRQMKFSFFRVSQCFHRWC